MSALARIENTPRGWSEAAKAASSIEAVGWTEQGQADRFAAVLDALEPQPADTFLDFGCGVGDLADHLPASVTYCGFDWARGMVRRGRLDHPGREFVFALDDDRRFDLIACVGTFNLPGGGWSKGQTWETLRRLWAVCGRAMAVSLYAGKDERCLRYEPGQVIAFAQIADRWRVARYRSNDLLMVMYR